MQAFLVALRQDPKLAWRHLEELPLQPWAVNLIVGLGDTLQSDARYSKVLDRFIHHSLCDIEEAKLETTSEQDLERLIGYVRCALVLTVMRLTRCDLAFPSV